MPDPSAGARARHRRNWLPPRALGEFGPVVETLAALRADRDTITPASAHLVVFFAEHAITDLELSADQPAAAARRRSELDAGDGPLAQLASTVSVGSSAVDLGGPHGRIDIEDALTHDQVADAVDVGRTTAADLIDAGNDLLIGALGGVGTGVAAAAIGSMLTGVEPVDATGRGTGVDDAAWSRRVAAVRDTRYRLGTADATTALRVAGGADLAALTGFVLESACRGIPVLLDDVPGAVAAVLAHRFAPGIERFVLVPGAQPGVLHRRLLGLLDISPVSALDLGSGPAVPSLLFWPLLRAAASAVDQVTQAPGDRAANALTEWDPGLL